MRTEPFSGVVKKDEAENVWPKWISVDRRIVKILSESTYDSFPHSLKELIVNSYDADAREVYINIDLKKEVIEIKDDGWGMSLEDFDFYLRIAGQQREKGIKTKSGRPIIGQFGVGFLSVFPFFSNYYVETKKTGSDEVLYADIPCYKYFARDKRRTIDISEITINGGIRYDKKNLDQHFTRITLTGFTPLAKAFFEIPEKAAAIGKHSILREAGLTKLRWFLEDDLPLKFEDTGFTERFKDEYQGLPFDVYINTDPLKRRVFGKTLMDFSDEFQYSGDIKYKYFICSNDEVINPVEATGIKIRNLNVGVGKRTTFGLGVETGGTRSRTRWITGEIHIYEGLNNAIKVSRDDFYFNTDYDELKIEFVSKISKIIKILEDERELSNFVTTNAIKDMRLLEPKSLTKKLNRVKTEKLDRPKVMASESNKDNRTEKSSQEVMFSNKAIRDIDPESYEKKYKIKGYEFSVKSEKWDYENAEFPACKIEGKKLIINKKYPLFSKSKNLDVFIRFSLLSLIWLNEKKISEKVFLEMSDDILDGFKDYY